MIKLETRPLPSFEEYYAKFTERKAQVEEEVKLEFEQELAKRTKVIDDLIASVSEIVEVEVEELSDDAVEETDENYTGV